VIASVLYRRVCVVVIIILFGAVIINTVQDEDRAAAVAERAANALALAQPRPSAHTPAPGANVLSSAACN
jgi:hypothetical protein